jgi:hypothetical protein
MAYDAARKEPKSEPVAKFSQRRMRLWHALNDFIRANGGWLVSAPHEKFLRVEVPTKSSLPSRLIEFGYDVKSGGVATRCTSGGLLPVDVITFALPVK